MVPELDLLKLPGGTDGPDRPGDVFRAVYQAGEPPSFTKVGP